MPRNKTGEDERLISALLSSRTLASAAKMADIPARTLYERLKQPEFVAMLNGAKSDMLTQAIVKLNYHSSTVVDVLVAVAEDAEQNAQVRVSACRGILDNVGRFNEQLDIMQRLDTLEAGIAENSRN